MSEIQTFPDYYVISFRGTICVGRLYSSGTVSWREPVTYVALTRHVCARCASGQISHEASYVARGDYGYFSGTLWYCGLICAKLHRGSDGRFTKPARRAAPPPQTADA